jgi:hypothetical protein
MPQRNAQNPVKSGKTFGGGAVHPDSGSKGPKKGGAGDGHCPACGAPVHAETRVSVFFLNLSQVRGIHGEKVSSCGIGPSGSFQHSDGQADRGGHGSALLPADAFSLNGSLPGL